MLGKHSRVVASVLALATGAVLTLSAGASAAPGSTRLSGNVARWVKDAQLVGHARASGTVYVSVYLSQRHQGALDSLLLALQTKGSDQYHQFLSPAEFAAQFGASKSTIDATAHWLASEGLKVTNKAGGNHYVDAVGTVATVQKAFGITENIYRYKGMKLRANAQAPRV
ncbi:MAG: protease pro-enzyme activation domain-containing protein, partial [Actinomycetota bacterium]|nr:protease pro-enzyme activation domain-containing protein [Actinomycetota bacterium]